MFPPGRARLATRPRPTRSAKPLDDEGDGRCRPLAAGEPGRPAGTITSDLEADEFGGDSGKLLRLPSPKRCSITNVCPSTQPSSRRPFAERPPTRLAYRRDRGRVPPGNQRGRPSPPAAPQRRAARRGGFQSACRRTSVDPIPSLSLAAGMELGGQRVDLTPGGERVDLDSLAERAG